MDSATDYRTLATRTLGSYFVRMRDGQTKDERLTSALDTVRSQLRGNAALMVQTQQVAFWLELSIHVPMLQQRAQAHHRMHAL